jgi:hypothetical protein
MEAEIKVYECELKVQNRNNITDTQARGRASVRKTYFYDRLYFEPNVEVEGVVSTADVIWCRTERWLCTGSGTTLKELSKTAGIPIRIGYLPNTLTSPTRTYKID